MHPALLLLLNSFLIVGLHIPVSGRHHYSPIHEVVTERISMEILILLYFTLALVFLLFFMNKRILSPTTIFLFSQVLFFFGLVQFLEYNSSKDKRIVWIYIVSILFFGAGSALGAKLFRYSKSNIVFVDQPLYKFQKQRVRLLILISIFLLIYFCYMTQFSTVNIMFGSLLGNDMGNITDNRLQSYSVPGTAYIYMFRVTLFPILVVSILNKEYKYSLPEKVVLVLIMVVFSLITGQRAGFVMVIFMWILSYMIKIFYRKNAIADKVNKGSKHLKRNLIVLFVAFFAIFSFLSIVNGRVSQNVLTSLITRFLSDNQRTAYISFHYIFDGDVSWGRNWYEELVNLVFPGERYLPLSKVINEIMYGTTRGTAPPCLWGSVFYNFSWPGVMLFALFYGIFLQYIEYRFYSKAISSIRCVIYSYIFISLGMLVAGGPFQLINNGFVPSVLLALILHVDKYAVAPQTQ